jgi:hypothetical protein
VPPFDAWLYQAWPYRFTAVIRVRIIVGGVPSDPRVAEAWIRTKLAGTEELIQEAVAEAMVERGITLDEAVKFVGDLRHLNGFKHDSEGLYIEGRQMKACVKESASIAGAAGKLNSLINGKAEPGSKDTDGKKWGHTGKGLLSFVAEHIMILDDRIHLGVTEPTSIMQHFVKTFRGTGIKYEEYVEDAELTFTVVSDWDFTDEQWAMIWLTAEQEGIGASRSQGFGKFTLIKWERQPPPGKS